MKKKLINKIILSLSIILAIITSYTVGKYISLKEHLKSTEAINQQTPKEETNLISTEMLIKKLDDENKLMVLSGESQIQAKYSNKQITDDDIGIVWLKDWFSEMSSKDLIVDATYTYQFYYDLVDLDLEVIGDTAYIYLSKNRLDCQVELLETKSIYTDRVGLFESNFTPQEINSINARTKELVLNKIRSERKLRDKALENAKKNIEELLNVKCNFKVASFDVVEYDSENLLKVEN